MRIGKIKSLRRWVVASFAGAALIVGLLAPTPARAIGPHEIVLVVNDDSDDSVLLALIYKRLRSVPDSNVVRLSIPRQIYDGEGTDISPENFTKYIWGPLNEAIEKAGLSRQVLAAVFSCGFPTKVTTPIPVSLTGAVFLRNNFPPKEEIDSGRYVSDLYAGPSNAETSIGETETFDSSRSRLPNDMPFPAMMLAFTGTNGTTVAKADAYLRLAATGDNTRPGGTIWFAVNNDVRSTSRHWEYNAVTNGFARHATINAIVSTNQPAAANFPLVGYMTGARAVRPSAFKFAPGAFAEHLTSFGAAFDQRAQTKVTEWLENGAAFTAGTVCEPYALWTKFPHACIYTHYVRGCTAIEAFYQSVRCPLQTLPLGDPLASPWSEKIVAQMFVPEGPLSGIVELKAAIVDERTEVFYRFQWFVDGVLVGAGRTLVWDTRQFPNGSHKVRVVVRRQLESVKQQGFTEIRVTLNNKK